jgi:glutathione synthase/RimK-type ligase-like ATP-grasp enzyme
MREIANKWTKFAVLSRHSDIKRHIPSMERFSAENLKSMLRQHAFVVAKPFVGTGGYRVVKVEQTGNGYLLHYDETKIKLHSWKKLICKLNQIRKGSEYMLQQGIRLSTINGNPVDYRVKMVKKNRSWVITAVVGRIARKGLFVTNLCRGGTLLKGAEALRQTFPARLVKSKINIMCGVARTCTHLLEAGFAGIGALGFDFGIDQRGGLWILEVNTKPH